MIFLKQDQHYDDVIMTMLASQITSLMVVYSIVYSVVNQRKHQSSASLAFVREIHRGPVNFPHKWPVTRKMFPFDDVIMKYPYIFRGQYYIAENKRSVWQLTVLSVMTVLSNGRSFVFSDLVVKTWRKEQNQYVNHWPTSSKIYWTGRVD